MCIIMKHATSSFCVSGRNKFSLFFKYSSILLLVLLVSGKSWGQTLLLSDDFTGYTGNLASNTGGSPSGTWTKGGTGPDVS